MYRMGSQIEDLVGMRIRNLRMKRRATLSETAAAVGVSESLLSRIENGHRRPAPELIERLAAFYGVSVDELLATESALTDEPVARVHSETAWPVTRRVHEFDSGTGTLVLAELAVTTALSQLRQDLASDDHVERYRACRSLAKLASQPLELLHEVCGSDDDPMVREATRQLLATLLEAYGTE